MARPIRVEFENAVYHVTARGNERRDIYRDVPDRRRFLETLEEAVERFGVVLHAYCLMPNHYHLLLQTPRANLSDAAGWLQTTYSIRFNRRHRRSGHLFQGRFKAQLVEADGYARELLKYIHLNPVRPKNKRRAVPAQRRVELSRYRWSSHRVYAGLGNTKRPAWLCTEWRSYFGRTRSAAQAEYRVRIAQMFDQVARSPWQDLRGGLVLGSETLWNKVRGLIAESEGGDEIRWSRRAGTEAVAREIDRLAAEQTDRRIAIWLQVRLGGRRMTAVAKQYGYSDGSGVHRVMQRLEGRAKKDRQLDRQLKSLARQMSRVKS
jgi:putative transposase